MADGDAVNDLDRAEQELHGAISEVLNRRGLMITKWLLAVEGLDQGGERVLETFTSPDFRAWDSLGFLGFLDARERGVAGAEAVSDMRGGKDDSGG